MMAALLQLPSYDNRGLNIAAAPVTGQHKFQGGWSVHLLFGLSVVAPKHFGAAIIARFLTLG
jgi:hypothetical protein